MNKQNKTGKRMLSVIFAALLVTSTALPASAALITKTKPASSTSVAATQTQPEEDEQTAPRSASGLLLGSGANTSKTAAAKNNTLLGGTAKSALGTSTGLRLGANTTAKTTSGSAIAMPSTTNKKTTTVPDSPTVSELASQNASSSSKKTVATKLSEEDYEDKVEDLLDDYSDAAGKCEAIGEVNADRAKSYSTKLKSLKNKFENFKKLSVPSKFSESAKYFKNGCTKMIDAINYATDVANMVIEDDKNKDKDNYKSNETSIERNMSKIDDLLSDAKSEFNDGESQFDSEK